MIRTSLVSQIWAQLERAFVAAGGLLLAGLYPTGAGDVLPGFGDERGIELLVEAGFSPVEAIKAATYNGAVSWVAKSKLTRSHRERMQTWW